jgi:hypothetical protein
MICKSSFLRGRLLHHRLPLISFRRIVYHGRAHAHHRGDDSVAAARKVRRLSRGTSASRLAHPAQPLSDMATGCIYDIYDHCHEEPPFHASHIPRNHGHWVYL